MNFIDNLIQTLFDIIDQLFWIHSDNGVQTLKKRNVFIAINIIIIFFFLLYILIH